MVSPSISRSIMPFTDSISNNMGKPQPLPITDLELPNGIAVDWVAG